MNAPSSNPQPTVPCRVMQVDHPVGKVAVATADGIAIGVIDGHLSIYLVRGGEAWFVHLDPDALDSVAVLLADAIEEITRQECPSLGAVQ